MKRLFALLGVLFLTFAPHISHAETRALLVACSDFVTQPDLGSDTSGNVQMIASALLGASPRIAGLSIEDGTIGTGAELAASIGHAFSEADEDDLSILYLCTHGILSSSDDSLAYLLLGNGEAESTLSGEELCAMLAPVQGDKLLILDACYSGALIGRGMAAQDIAALPSAAEPFLRDTSLHVLTSAGGQESSWYYDSAMLSSGAVSYFASALSSGLGLYGDAEADLNGDGEVTLTELQRHLNAAVPSSACQLLSASPDALALPAVHAPMLSRPLAGFSYGELLLTADAPALDFSFTVTGDTAVQYRLIDYENGHWNWEAAKTFLDGGEGGSQLLAPGRKTRTLMLTDIAPEESGFLMLQVFSLQNGELQLCSERLIAVQPESTQTTLGISCPDSFVSGRGELPIAIDCAIPAEITVSILDADGALVRRICRSLLTHPAPDDVTRLYWDGKDAQGSFVPEGNYTITSDAVLCSQRVKASAQVHVTR